jgi:MFS transporter, DHA1 family, multidrug resistance protein
MQKGRKRNTVIFCLGLLSAIGPFSIDMYLPGFPAIAANLHTTVDRVALSLSSYFVGISLGQLVYGPLVDRFGRKKPLYIGLVIYMIASLCCAAVHSVEMLIALRFVQAMGVCVGLVASRAMVRDLFPVSESAKVFSMLMLVLAVSPLVAPTVGGYFAAGPGWQWIFVALAILGGLILTASVVGLPESRQPNPEVSLRPKPIITSFAQVLRQPQCYIYTFSGAIASAGMYAYIAGSPNVFIKIFGVSEKHYGWLFAFNAAGLIGCSQLNTLALRRFNSEQISKMALMAQALVGACLLTGTASGVLTVYTIVPLFFIYLGAQGFIFPNLAALAMAPFSRNAGTASALMGAIQLGIASLATATVSLFSDGTARPMTAIMMCCSAVGLTVLLLGNRYALRRHTSATAVEGQAVEMVTEA